MTNRKLPWFFLGAAIALAVIAIAVSGFGAYQEHPHDPFEHVGDVYEWHIFESLHISIPLVRISKFMILELIAAGLIAAIFIPMARRLTKDLPRGAWDNAFEGVLTFIRDQIAKPNLGEEDADKYVPLLWTLFFFILFNNLLGMLPWMGSPTANLYVTGALALVSFVVMHGAAMYKMGVVHYFLALWPHIEIVPSPWRSSVAVHGHHAHGGHGSHSGAGELPASKPSSGQIVAWIAGTAFGIVLQVMIFGIEMMGTVIKSGVLAVRLFANMFAGHSVLAMILAFIVMTGNALPLLWGGITVASVLGVTALSLLELFVGFLQTYIFVFLTALFMGMALHPAH